MSDPDRTLARRAGRGDRRALVALYERHRSRLFGFLLAQLGDPALAEDVFQEVWIKVMRRIDTYHAAGTTFRAWLFRVAANAAVDRMRRERLRRTEELDAPQGPDGERRIDRLLSDQPGPDALGEGRLLGRDLARALARLPERQRSAVLLRHQQGLSYPELARALAIPEGTGKTLVHRGLQTLRALLAGWRPEETEHEA